MQVHFHKFKNRNKFPHRLAQNVSGPGTEHFQASMGQMRSRHQKALLSASVCLLDISRAVCEQR